MQPLKLAVIGHINYHDELKLGNIINDHIKAVYNPDLFDSVEIHFRIVSKDDSFKIGRFCNIYNYRYVGYKPNWLDFEKRPGVAVKIKNKDGYQYNSLAAVNMNNGIIGAVDYVIILKDENTLHNNTKDADVSIFKHLTKNNIPNDRTNTIYFNSGVMKHTNFVPDENSFLNSIESKGKELVPFSEELLKGNKDWFKVDWDSSFYLFNSHWNENILRITDLIFKNKVDNIIKETTNIKEYNFSPKFTLLDSTDVRLGVNHLIKFECLMVGSDSNTIRRMNVVFYWDVITFIRILLHIQYINIEFNKGNHNPRNFVWSNPEGYGFKIITETQIDGGFVILFTAMIKGVYYKQAYNHHKCLLNDPRGRIVWRSEQILEIIQEWQSEKVKQNSNTP